MRHKLQQCAICGRSFVDPSDHPGAYRAEPSADKETGRPVSQPVSQSVAQPGSQSVVLCVECRNTVRSTRHIQEADVEPVVLQRMPMQQVAAQQVAVLQVPGQPVVLGAMSVQFASWDDANPLPASRSQCDHPQLWQEEPPEAPAPPKAPGTRTSWHSPPFKVQFDDVVEPDLPDNLPDNQPQPQPKPSPKPQRRLAMQVGNWLLFAGVVGLFFLVWQALGTVAF